MDIKKLLKSVHATQSKKKIIVFKDKKIHKHCVLIILRNLMLLK